MCDSISIQARQLLNLLPPSNDLKNIAFELVRAVLVRSNYIPVVRHCLGWCGIHEIVGPDSRHGTLTIKVNKRPGIFGLLPLESIEESHACFALCYFPTQNDPVLEELSLQAGVRAMAEDFTDRIRSFPLDPGLADLFHIGFIHAGVQKSGVFLALTACKRLGWTSDKGITIQGPKGVVQAVSPGGIDQDLGALAIAMDFFDSLAASFTYTLASDPTLFYTRQRPATPLSPLFHKSLEHRLTLGYFTDKPWRETGWENEEKKNFWTSSRPLPQTYEEKLWWTTKSASKGSRPDKNPEATGCKPRFILLTGFLGSGKTSFLDTFIQAQTANNSFVAVVQNEIGKKGLDAKLLDQTYAVTQMDEGCVCCSLAGNLRSALGQITDRFAPDFIVLETTGLANPANILREIEDLSDILEFGSITTIVDGLAGEQSLLRFEVARDQVRLADIILLNKCDLGEPEKNARLEQQIRQLNPAADIHQTCHGYINPAVLYGTNFRNTPKRPLFTAIAGKQSPTHRRDRIETRFFELTAPLDRKILINAIDAGGKHILRVKGLVEFTDHQGPMVFQYSPGSPRISQYNNKEDCERFLVVIGQELEKSFCPSFLTTPGKEVQ
ncbi:MAG: GTP-binding protein [Proteobacteria bacterium]|nr:GTP-binding protein [Pseudomonadota bacterium]